METVNVNLCQTNVRKDTMHALEMNNFHWTCKTFCGQRKYESVPGKHAHLKFGA